jgi:hypothetical protein
VIAAVARFSPNVPLAKDADGFTVSDWLSRLRGSTPVVELAARCGHSRFAVARWLKGQAKPRVPEFFELVDGMTGRLPEWVAELVPIDQVPQLRDRFVAAQAAKRLAFEAPWTEAVLALLETTTYRQLPRHRPGFIAACLGISEVAERECLAKLEAAQLIERRARRYAVNSRRNVDTQGGRMALHRLKQHWSLVAARRLDAPQEADLFAYNVMSLSRADLERVRERLRAAFREIRLLVAGSAPEEVVALMNVQLVPFVCEPPPDR